MSYVVTFERGDIVGPGQLEGLRRMSLADALEVLAMRAGGRVVDVETGRVLPWRRTLSGLARETGTDGYVVARLAHDGGVRVTVHRDAGSGIFVPTHSHRFGGAR